MRFRTKLTKHAKEKLGRLYGLTEDFVIRDVNRYIYTLKKKRGSNEYKITTHTAKYILGENLEVITILYKRDKEGKRESKYRKTYLGEQWQDMSKEAIRDKLKSIINK